MIANYHTHTPRCGHADGDEREYIEAAIAGGMKILGFADHAPWPFPGDYVSGCRMTMAQLEDYTGTLVKLREEYKDDIEIRIGLEAEYYPDLFDDFIRIIDQSPVEYLILGQHFFGNEIGEDPTGWRNSDKEKLTRYVDQVIAGLETGRYLYVCHPDLIRYVGDEDFYISEMRRLCVFAKEKQIPLEVNFLGLSTGRHYPNPLFWKVAGETGNTAVFAADAHTPSYVINPEAERLARQLMARSGITRIVETLKIEKHA